MVINIILSIIIILIMFAFLFLKFKTNSSKIQRYEEKLNINILIHSVKTSFEDILNKNIAELNLNKNETMKRESIKAILRKSLRTCSHGDIGAKEYIKDYINDILQRKLNINEQNIDEIIEFNDSSKLTVQDKFEILLYKYKQEYQLNALSQFIDKYNLDVLKTIENDEYYDIDKNDIHKIYKHERMELSFEDKIGILTQRIYQLYKGLGTIDEIRDMKIDGVSGGVSGIPNDFYSYDLDYLDRLEGMNLNSYNSIWIFYKGKTIRLSFLGFYSQRELVRVCKNIYRHDHPGQLSQAKGFIVNEMKDGSRVVTFRPPFSASWAFLVRKFDSIERKEIEFLLTDKGSDRVIQLIKSLVRSYQDIIITGTQGCGKTTLMMSLIQFFNRRCNLRVYELIFELFPQKIYPNMNILSLRETDTVFGQDALDIIKKTDGDITMIGEIATYEAANWLVETSQVASKCVLGTHHAVTTEDLIDYFRNAALRLGGFRDEQIAEQQVIKAINFDIHMVKDRNGYRYIERITEIIPLQNKNDSNNLKEAMFNYYIKRNSKSYETVDIVQYRNGSYHIVNNLSDTATERIRHHLSEEEFEDLNKIFIL